MRIVDPLKSMSSCPLFHAFCLVLTTDLLEDRCMDDVSVKNILLFNHIKQK